MLEIKILFGVGGVWISTGIAEKATDRWVAKVKEMLCLEMSYELDFGVCMCMYVHAQLYS